MAAKSEKPVMLGARISPKAQFGLRLLARIQGRTIADAVEWSINMALRATRVGDGNRRLATLVDTLWGFSSDARRVYHLDMFAPELLDFEQRSAWNLVGRCPDLWRTAFYTTDFDEETGEHRDIEVEKDDPRVMDILTSDVPRFDLIEKHWGAIVKTGSELVQIGDLETRFTLEEILSGEALDKSRAS